MRNKAMLFRPFLLLFRKRLIATAILSVVVAILAAHTDNVETLFFFVCLFLGWFLGRAGADKGVPEMRFLLTRPIPRLAAFFRPLVVAAFAIALFPLASFFLMLGLLHFGSHASRLHPVATMSLTSAHRLDVVLSLTVYASVALGRWGYFSLKWINRLEMWSPLLLGGMFWFRPWRLWKGAGLEYLLLSIIFIVWAFGALYGPWRVLQGIDELPEPSLLSPTVEVAEKIRALRAAREAR